MRFIGSGSKRKSPQNNSGAGNRPQNGRPPNGAQGNRAGQAGGTSRYAAASAASRRPPSPQNNQNQNRAPERSERRSPKSKRTARIIIAVVCLLAVIGCSAFAIVRWRIQPFYDFFFRPDENILAVIQDDGNATLFNPDNPDEIITAEEEREGERGSRLAALDERNTDKFTFLILGIDYHANTDAIMVATFDSVESTLEVVSIPRDTLVNVSWNVRKVNSIMSQMNHRFRNEPNREEVAMQATVEHFSDILGFNVDFWVTINQPGFTRLIDAVGPIDFYVPGNMDEYGIQVSRGQQRLNGEQALTVMRTRRIYANADIGRVNTQQDFLHVLAGQILARRDQISVQDYANIFIGNVRTDIQLNHLVWLGRELLTLDPEDINFTIMPHSLATINRGSYVTINVDEWLELINSTVNPLYRDITIEDVSILTHDANRRLFVTDGEWRGSPTWGGGPGR